MKEISIFDIPDEDERGVSPVIGVILMVAITVILAAVIASFVLGFGSSVQENVNAGADIEVDEGDTDGTAEVTWISQGNAESVNVTVTYNGSTNGVDLSEVGQVATIEEEEGVGSSPKVAATGKTITVEENGNGDGVHDKEITIVVKAVKGETTTVIEKDTVTI